MYIKVGLACHVATIYCQNQQFNLTPPTHLQTTITNTLFFHTTNMSSSSPGSSQLAGNARQRFAYRFSSNDGQTSYLYISDFGKGAQSQAQLVKNTQTGQVIVRKVWKVLARRTVTNDTPFRPLKLRELVLLDVIKQIPTKEGVPNYIASYLSYEYVKAAFSTTYKADQYRLTSYWPVYNGGPAADMSGLGNEVNITAKLPLAAIARMVWQVYGSLHHIYSTGADYIVHFDIHMGNILLHWENKPADAANPASLLPDFILVDFSESFFYSELRPTQADRHPELADIQRMNKNLLLTIKELAVLGPNKKFELTPADIAEFLLPGPHNPAALKLLEIYQAGQKACTDYVAKYPSRPDHPDPPSLMEVVRLGKEMEAMCLPGGVADETQTNPVFHRFVT